MNSGAGEGVTVNRRIAQAPAFGELAPDEAAARCTAEAEGFPGTGE